MCGTVAWLQGKTCRDDEQFDLAAWFPSLAYSWARVASFLYLVIAFAVELLLICLCWYSVCDISQRNAMAESLRPKSWMAF
jgi:hypothetical protein